jgi:hypothetical protein
MEINMSKTFQWVIGVSVVVIGAAFVFSAIWMFVAHGLGWNGGYGMMAAGQAHMPMLGQTSGSGMTGGFGMPFMGLGMYFWPLVVVGLIVLGLVSVTRTVRAPSAPQPPAVTATCAHCGQPLHTRWKVCPNCREKI